MEKAVPLAISESIKNLSRSVAQPFFTEQTEDPE
jgi:hypothetical protein